MYNEYYEEDVEETSEENTTTDTTYDPYNSNDKNEPSDFDVAFNILGLFN